MIDYKFADCTDWPDIVQFLGDLNYFSPVDPYWLGGHWLIAKSRGKIVGTLWFFGEAPHAHIDYWASRYPRVAAVLIAAFIKWCEEHDVYYLHGIVASDNTAALRMITEGCGGTASAPYHRVYKELERI